MKMIHYIKRWKYFLIDIDPNNIEDNNKHRKIYYEKKMKCIPKMDEIPNDPLNLKNTNPWHTIFNEEKLLNEINKDLYRLYPEGNEYFFQNNVSQKILCNILFIWCKENPFLSYRQGMHDLLSIIVYANLCKHKQTIHLNKNEMTELDYGNILFLSPLNLTTTNDLLSSTYLYEIEADSYIIFNALMSSLQYLYEIKLPKKINNNINSYHTDINKENKQLELCNLIQNKILFQLDPALYAHLKKHNVYPELYSLRWTRLLFCREFSLDKTLILWDLMFYDIYTLKNKNNIKSIKKFNLSDYPTGPPMLKYLCVAILIYLSMTLINKDNSGCLEILMKPIGKIIESKEIIFLSLAIKNTISNDTM